ncbi:glycoside hydrolase family 3 protein [Sphaerisporangium corydalis]|uniref:Glycoside hydrolase family 3 N-terminal domain-containing protein n=1 Tax=Sphaerisporangium corydalis TaxID=1441875 RepID=A0ABV9E668_9ACTN|nr:exo 1,3/1,4-beta-D-glucan glucohydrolase [Sphaerisporangium corydalis]
MIRPPVRAGLRRSALAVLAGLTLLTTGAAVVPSAGAAADPGAEAAKGTRQPVIGKPDTDSHGCARIEKSLPPLAGWPKVKSQIKQDPSDERRIAKIVAGMTLAEKIGQMTQPEISAITPAEVAQYFIGSVLNGGGSWPGGDKHATPKAWLDLADAYWQASTGTRTKIPVIWGIDAVHGNNNVYGATLFPHNIGLGAAHDPCLVRDIGAATAEQIHATGQDWAFAPTLAVVRDDRWGRTYEGFSEDPRITRAYGYEAVRGLQGGNSHGIGGKGVIATAKHYIGDGGTLKGTDQGVNPSSEADMINIHGQGYYGALAAGAQTVMASFNSWTNADLGINEGKMHGSKLALTDILKQKMGFDGVVVSDWNGIGQVTGCTNSSCARAVNAGIDVVMVPNDWKAFITNTTAQVQSGEIPIARVNDAVTRILRVKMRAGVFGARKPSARALAGSADALQAKRLARQAVRESQVLLKNNGKVLPLVSGSKVLVVGKSADSMQNQSGGWTLSWQGTGNTNADFPNGTTVLAGLREALGAADVTFSETADGVDPSAYDAVIAVIGETPYAEGVGDLGRRTLEAAKLYPGDLAVLDKVHGKGAPVVTVYLSGRPMYVNKELNRSEAFVAAWLPGTEGAGVADLLVRSRHRDGYTGKLSYSWPKSACQTPLNPGTADYDPLFPLGYGLRDGQTGSVGTLDETSPDAACGSTGGGGTATEDLSIFDRTDVAPYKSFIGSPENWGGTEIGVDGTASHAEISVVPSDVNVQQDGLKATWNGGPAQIYMQDPAGGSDLRGYLNADAALVFDTIVHQAPAARTVISAHCVYPCFAEVVATSLFQGLPIGTKATVKIPISCFAAGGLDLEVVNTPFLVYTEAAFSASFANVRWVPGAAKDADAQPCSALT